MMDGSLEADMKTPASFEYNVDVTACRALHNNGAIGFVCSLHNRMHLLHIVNIEWVSTK
jgi:hypothetical protein